MGIFSRGLSKTRQSFLGQLDQIISGTTDIDEDTWEDVEAILIQADLGVETTNKIMHNLRDRVAGEEIKRTEKLQKAFFDCVTGKSDKYRDWFAPVAA